ncbi:FAD-dependent oxidoreductase [Nitratireductor thuwali]|uniref:Cytochrome b6-f complex iron-sulfur subunit n=1 Tax=Nitratireductor thuwali TaxID=2267699 RepID=A0ABY5MMU0_9HYPH|nr:Cytochrome b6-f complex iron-sulfur subunit [Nitratireductor thuwali]
MVEATPFWLDGAAVPAFAAVGEDMRVDVAIVGGGIVGLHCALNLRASGLRVAVFEARRFGRQATGRSTAKVTSQHGLRYGQLKRDFGDEYARVYADANQKAIENIARLCAELDGGAGFQRRDAFVYACNDDEADRLQEEAEAAASLGLPASMEHAAGLPLQVTSLLKFKNQAQFDPAAYLGGLAGLLSPDVKLFEQSRVTSIEDGEPYRLASNGHTITAGHVVVATQMPIVNDGMFFAKAFPFAHPVAAAPLPEGIPVDGVFISAGSPSHSFRTAQRDDQVYLVAAGGEYKPAHPDEQAGVIEDLLRFLREHFRIEQPTHLWTNEDFRSMDGAAFIGPATSSKPNLLVATGFAAWGITQGAVAGEILAARILGQEHEAAALFEARRVKPLVGGSTFLSENARAGAHMVSDRLMGAKSGKPEDIAPGGAGIVSIDGKQVAFRRTADGQPHGLSAKCTHMGCIVDWNAVDRTWDCPCHGSRFDENGRVLAGPAASPLEPRRVGPKGERAP